MRSSWTHWRELSVALVVPCCRAIVKWMMGKDLACVQQSPVSKCSCCRTGVAIHSVETQRLRLVKAGRLLCVDDFAANLSAVSVEIRLEKSDVERIQLLLVGKVVGSRRRCRLRCC